MSELRAVQWYQGFQTITTHPTQMFTAVERPDLANTLPLELWEMLIAESPFVRRLAARGHLRTFNGGRTIIEELEYKGKEYINPEDQLTGELQPDENKVFNYSEYPIRQAALVFHKGVDVKESIKAFVRAMCESVMSDGAVAGSINGLRLFIGSDPTAGTIGGINRDKWTFWRPQFAKANANDPWPVVNDLWHSFPKDDKPDLIMVDQDVVEGSFDKSTVFVDKTQPGKGEIRLINTRYFRIRSNARRNMVFLNTENFQDEVIRALGWAGNLTCSNVSRQGIVVTQ